MFCSVCGREIAGQAKFCPYCGSAVRVPVAIESAVPGTVPGYAPPARQVKGKMELRPLDWEAYRKARTLYIVAASGNFASSMVAMSLSNIWDPETASQVKAGLVIWFLLLTVVFFVVLIVATCRVAAVLGFSPGSWAIAIISLLLFSLISIGYMIYKMDEAQKSGMAGLGGHHRCPACGKRIKAGVLWCPGCGFWLV
jgi:hypothetical protein